MPKIKPRPASESVINNGRPGRSIDPVETYSQIGMWTLAELGAKNKAYSKDYIQFDVTLVRSRRVIVKLDANDTYSVEIGRMRKIDYLPTYEVLSQVTDIYCDQLSEVIRRAVLESR